MVAKQLAASAGDEWAVAERVGARYGAGAGAIAAFTALMSCSFIILYCSANRALSSSRPLTERSRSARSSSRRAVTSSDSLGSPLAAASASSRPPRRDRTGAVFLSCGAAPAAAPHRPSRSGGLRRRPSRPLRRRFEFDAPWPAPASRKIWLWVQCLIRRGTLVSRSKLKILVLQTDLLSLPHRP
jgi:hypothetical protein